jgi:hypothetical protein
MVDAVFAVVGCLAVTASVAVLSSSAFHEVQTQELDDLYGDTLPAQVEGNQLEPVASPEGDSALAELLPSPRSQAELSELAQKPALDKYLARHNPLEGFHTMPESDKAEATNREASLMVADERKIAQDLDSAHTHQSPNSLTPYTELLPDKLEESASSQSSHPRKTTLPVAPAMTRHVQMRTPLLPLPKHEVTEDPWAEGMGEWDGELVAMQHAAEELKELYPQQYPKLSRDVQKIAQLYPDLRGAFASHNQLDVEQVAAAISARFEVLQSKVMELEREAAEHQAEVQYYEEQDIPRTAVEWQRLYDQLHEEVQFVMQYFPQYAAEVQEHVNNVKQIQDLLQGSKQLENTQEEDIYRQELSDSIEALYAYVDRLAQAPAAEHVQSMQQLADAHLPGVEKILPEFTLPPVDNAAGAAGGA